MNSNFIKILSIYILITVSLSGCAKNIENNNSGKNIQSKNLSSGIQNEVIKSDLLFELAQNEIKDNTSSRIYSLIENAKIEDLDDIYYIISDYCFLKHKNTEMNNGECQKMINSLIVKGDILKEETFEEIKNDKENLVRRLNEFQALLMSQRKASGDDKYFSTENVEKVNVETKKIMKKRFENILENGTFEELYKELILVMANTPASCGTKYETTKSPNDFGLYGAEICEFKQKIINRARQKLVNSLGKKDLCELTNEEKSKIINDLYNCNELIDDEEVCEKIDNKELVSGYNKLVEKYFSNNKKIDCEKENETTIEYKEQDKEEKYKETEDLIEETEINIQDRFKKTGQTTEIEINYFPEVFIGWDFEILSEGIGRNDVYDCIIECGFVTPLELISKEPLICYDYMLNEDVVCESKPIVPEDIKVCVEDCLVKFDQ